MRARCFAISLLLVLPCLWSARQANAAEDGPFPQKPIKLVIPDAPGNVTDLLGRLVAQRLSLSLGQPVAVEHVPGAGAMLGIDAVSRAPADGYTILLTTSSLVIQPLLHKQFRIELPRNLAPLSLAGRGAYVIAASSDLLLPNLGEMVTFSKLNPDRLKYGATDQPTRLAFELLKSMTGASIRHVPFASGQSAFAALLRGEVPVIVDTAVAMKPYIDRGLLQPLAVTGKYRSDQLPQVPTAAESGVIDYKVNYWIGFFAPGATPAHVIRKLSENIVLIVRDPELKAEFMAMGLEPAGTTPDEFMRVISSERTLWSKVIRDARIGTD